MRVSNFQDDRAEGTAAVTFAGAPDACIIYHNCLILFPDVQTDTHPRDC